MESKPSKLKGTASKLSLPTPAKSLPKDIGQDSRVSYSRPKLFREHDKEEDSFIEFDEWLRKEGGKAKKIYY